MYIYKKEPSPCAIATATYYVSALLCCGCLLELLYLFTNNLQDGKRWAKG